MNKFYTSERSQQIVMALLKAHGIRKAVVSPGTTNLTLVASMQQDPWFELYSSVDERSAAYLACGLAAESGEPVVLSCTGATASRNYMSGLTEAYYRKLPILAITANQGRDKVGHLVPQNIDRSALPNDIAKTSVFVAPVTTKEEEWYCSVLVNKAILELTHNGGGPAHINLSTTYSRDYSVRELPPAQVINRVMPHNDFPELPEGRIAICIGSHKPFSTEETELIDSFCAEHDAVVFCDHTSGYKGQYRVLFALVGSQEQYDSPCRRVDTLIHLGEVSGDYDGMHFNTKQVWRVCEDGEIRDTFKRLRYVFEMPESSFFAHYASGTNTAQVQNSYLEACRQEYRKVHAAAPELPFSNLWIARQISARLPEHSVLHLGILNSLRSWNMFEIPQSVQSYCNVGGFGIDGNLSSLIGASLVHPEKLYFGVIGDLAFFYDMNALGNRHVGNNIRILLINNGKGTEFRNYNHPGAAFGEAADDYIAAARHYGNKSTNLVKHYAEDLGYEYASATSKEEFLQHADRFLHHEASERPMVLEVFTDSELESSALHTLKNSVSDFSTNTKKTFKNILRSVVGEKGVKLLKERLQK